MKAQMWNLISTTDCNTFEQKHAIEALEFGALST